ncbi:IS982 family transposase [Candidatus Parcubacteria bacterium]|nr:MAG: IS982 family transposase [Candidatus Parcubacteria bacterium]
MINDFEDFCTWMYVIVDDIWQQIAPFFKRPGPQPKCSDSELITMAIVGECRGWDVETEMLSHWQEHRDMFPTIPSQSRFNRRRRNLMMAFNLTRRIVLQMLDLAQDRQCIIDSLPIPVVQFYLVPGSTGDWKAYGATFGKVASKKETIFGYKLHLLVTVSGLILDFELAPANATDLEVGFELLSEHTDLEVLGDKAYISADKAAQLWHQNRIRLKTIPRCNQKQQLPAHLKKMYNKIRQIIETVNGQLSQQFNIEKNRAHTFWGLCTRLYTKLAAHTLCIFLNRLLGNPDFLQIKALAFPN